MALCRSFIHFNPQFQRLHAANLICPPGLARFTALSLPAPLSSLSSSSMETPPEGYRKNVGICLINPSKKIFAASRLDIPEAWQMPQGGIDENEEPRDAAIRELREETGVTSADIVAEKYLKTGSVPEELAILDASYLQLIYLPILKAPYWLTYDFPPEVREKLNRLWGSDWKGQAQKWFLFKFTGKDEEVNLLGDGTEKAEFGQWSWVSPQEIVDRAVDFKKPVYQEVLKVFSPHIE